LLWIAGSISTYHIWKRGADHRDFYPWWAAARGVVEGSSDIYSPEATRSIQVRLYGSEIPEGRDQQGFAYPAILIPFLIPFALIPDVEVATAIWEGLTVVFVVSALSLAQDHLRRRISPIPVVLSILWFYTLLMIFLGQINGLILAGIGIGYWAYRHQFDLLAGVLISATFVKPDLVILPVVTLVAFALIRRRWKFILGVLTGLLDLLLSACPWPDGGLEPGLKQFSDMLSTQRSCGLLACFGASARCS
jgi:hypothetical protein